MQIMSLRIPEKKFLIQLICVVVFLWVNLFPAIHQFKHILIDYSHSECSHNHEIITSEDDEHSLKIKSVNPDCYTCKFTANLQPTMLVEDSTDSILDSVMINIKVFCIEQYYQSECKINYEARAGPLKS
jgi:hypothetical protein